MLFSWLRRRRRQRLLVQPMPAEWDDFFQRIPHVQILPDAEKSRLRDAMRIFLAERTWEGCKGFVVTDEVKVTISSLACILLLGMPDFYFDNVLTLLIYPKGFRVRGQVALGSESALVQDEHHLGEAHLHGPVILSWAEILEDLEQPGTGCNLVFHEFAHQLDMLDGEANGVPPLPTELRDAWEKVLGAEYQKLTRAVDRGRRTFLDPYGATNPTEFFAVVTEMFFDVPIELREEHPQLYDVLAKYYRVDPAAWHAT